MVEAREGRLDVVLLSHLEVLSEVLVSAPPVSVDEGSALVLPDLMQVRVAHVVLLAVDGESAVGVGGVEELVGLADVPSPVVDHALLLGLGQQVEGEALVKVEEQQRPDNSNSVLTRQSGRLPEGVAPGVLHEASDVLEGSPLLSHVAGLRGPGHELGEVAIGLLGQGSAGSVVPLTFQSCRRARSCWGCRT